MEGVLPTYYDALKEKARLRDVVEGVLEMQQDDTACMIAFCLGDARLHHHISYLHKGPTEDQVRSHLFILCTRTSPKRLFKDEKNSFRSTVQRRYFDHRHHHAVNHDSLPLCRDDRGHLPLSHAPSSCRQVRPIRLRHSRYSCMFPAHIPSPMIDRRPQWTSESHDGSQYLLTAYLHLVYPQPNEA